MSSISHLCKEGSIVSNLRTNILLGCRARVMLSWFLTKYQEIPVVFYVTCILLFSKSWIRFSKLSTLQIDMDKSKVKATLVKPFVSLFSSAWQFSLIMMFSICLLVQWPKLVSA